MKRALIRLNRGEITPGADGFAIHVSGIAAWLPASLINIYTPRSRHNHGRYITMPVDLARQSGLLGNSRYRKLAFIPTNSEATTIRCMCDRTHTATHLQ